MQESIAMQWRWNMHRIFRQANAFSHCPEFVFLPLIYFVSENRHNFNPNGVRAGKNIGTFYTICCTTGRRRVLFEYNSHICIYLLYFCCLSPYSYQWINKKMHTYRRDNVWFREKCFHAALCAFCVISVLILFSAATSQKIILTNSMQNKIRKFARIAYTRACNAGLHKEPVFIFYYAFSTGLFFEQKYCFYYGSSIVLEKRRGKNRPECKHVKVEYLVHWTAAGGVMARPQYAFLKLYNMNAQRHFVSRLSSARRTDSENQSI